MVRWVVGSILYAGLLIILSASVPQLMLQVPWYVLCCQWDGPYKGSPAAKPLSRKEMFYLTTHSTHFIYGYMASDIWLQTFLIVRKETCCRHIGYSFRLTASVLLYAPSHRQDSTYHGLCYNSHGALAGTRNSSMGPPHEGSIRRSIAPWANIITTELHLTPIWVRNIWIKTRIMLTKLYSITIVKSNNKNIYI